MKKFCKERWKDSRNFCFCAIAFGMGLIISCFCPNGLIMFIAAVIIVALGIAVVKCNT